MKLNGTLRLASGSLLISCMAVPRKQILWSHAARPSCSVGEKRDLQPPWPSEELRHANSALGWLIGGLGFAVQFLLLPTNLSHLAAPVAMHDTIIVGLDILRLGSECVEKKKKKKNEAGANFNSHDGRERSTTCVPCR